MTPAKIPLNIPVGPEEEMPLTLLLILFIAAPMSEPPNMLMTQKPIAPMAVNTPVIIPNIL